MTNYLAPSDMYAGGVAPPGGVGAMPVAGQSAYPPQFMNIGGRGNFNYAAPQQPGGIPVGTASSAATSMLGLAGYGVGAAGTVAGVGSMFTGSEGALGALSMLDATGMSALMSVGGAGVFGGGLGAAALAAPPALAGMAAAGGAAFAGQQAMVGGRQFNQVRSNLSGFNFANSSAPMGRGFDFSQVRQITDMMREFEAADPFITMKDMTDMMDRFGQTGITQGVQNAKEFGRKFKKYMDAVRSIATELGTTLGEASKTFGQMRQIGFYDTADVLGNTRAMQVAGGMGMDSQVFLGMQAGASATTRQANMSGVSGARTAARFSGDMLLGATSRNSGGLGLFSGEELMDLTGASTSAEAAAQMGGQFTGLMTRYLRSAPGGRALLAGVGAQEGGRFTGDIDVAKVGQFASGELGLEDLSSQGGRRMQTGRQRSSFTVNDAGIASSLMESNQGVEAALGSIEESAHKWAGGRYNEDDAVKLFLEKVVGADELMAEKISEFMAHRVELRAAASQRMRQEQSASAMQLDVARNRTFSGLKQRLTGALSDWIAAPIQGFGTHVAAGAEETLINLQDSAFGVERGTVTRQQNFDRAARAQSGQSAAHITAYSFRDTAEGSVARQLSGQMGGEQVRGVMRRALRGEQLNRSDFGHFQYGDEIVAAATAGTRDDELRRIAISYDAAKRDGDTAGASRARKAFEAQVQRHAGGHIQRGSIGTPDTARVMAMVANEVGASGLARDITLEGGTKSHTASDIAAARKNVMSAAKYAGLDRHDARQLATGGAGANIFAWAGRSDKNSGKLEELLSSDEMLAAGGDTDEMAAIFTRNSGITVTGEDIEAAQGMLQNIDAPTSTWGRFTRGGSGPLPESRESRIASLAHFAAASQDTRAASLGNEAATANITMMSSELRAAMGESTVRGISRGDSSAYVALAKKVRSGAFTNIAGGQELDAARVRMERAAESNSGLFSAYGFDDAASAESWGAQMKIHGIDSDGTLTDAERELLVQRLGEADIRSSIEDATGGGLVARGQTAEERTAYQMGFTADKVKQMAEVVDRLVTTAENAGLVEQVSDTSE